MPRHSRSPRERQVLRKVRDLASRDPERAIMAIDEYLSTKPQNPVDVLIAKGNILDSMAKFDQAVHAYRRVLRLDPQNVPAWIDLGDYYANVKYDFRAALGCYNRALHLLTSGHHHFDKEDEFIDACSEKACVLVQLDRPLEAMRCLINGLLRYPLSSLLLDGLQKARRSYDEAQGVKDGKRDKRKEGRVLRFWEKREKRGRTQ